MLDVLSQYEILGFCRLGLNRLKFYRTQICYIMTKNQISAGCRFIENKSVSGKVVISYDLNKN